MSYDLYFYKEKSKGVREEEIASYLSTNLVAENEHGNQWFFENPHTEVYYSFERSEASEDPEDIELYESFADFDNTHFSFNLNFMRPAFFGLEAFAFVEKMINDLNLYLLNPQLEPDLPVKQSKEALFDNWNYTNIGASARHFKETQSSFIAQDKSNAIWEYNFNKKRLQSELGNDYFVPKVFFCKKKETGEVITLASWTQHIPNVFPPADYFMLWRKYRKWFKTVEDNIVIDRAKLLKEFGEFFDDFYFKDCKIIHPNKTIRIEDKFNSIKGTVPADFAEAIPMENLYNAKPIEDD